MTTEEINAALAENIAALRRNKGLTQSELAERLHYSDKLISKWEQGSAAPNAAALWQMAEIFGVSVQSLYTGEGESSAPPPAEVPRNKVRERALIALIALCGILTAAMLGFVVSWIVGRPLPRIFLYVIPASLITAVVLNSVWNRGKGNAGLIGALVAIIVTTIYVLLLPRNCWQLFLLLIPAEAIVWLSAALAKKQ